MKSRLTIGELAARFALPTHVLRHWESKGLLSPPRDAAGQRHYTEADLSRVAMILMGKEAGLKLNDLSEILSTPDPMAHQELLRRQVDVLRDQITKAQVAMNLIEHALACPHPFAECAHAHEQISARIPPAAVL